MNMFILKNEHTKPLEGYGGPPGNKYKTIQEHMNEVLVDVSKMNIPLVNKLLFLYYLTFGLTCWSRVFNHEKN